MGDLSSHCGEDPFADMPLVVGDQTNKFIARPVLEELPAVRSEVLGDIERDVRDRWVDPGSLYHPEGFDEIKQAVVTRRVVSFPFDPQGTIQNGVVLGFNQESGHSPWSEQEQCCAFESEKRVSELIVGGAIQISHEAMQPLQHVRYLKDTECVNLRYYSVGCGRTRALFCAYSIPVTSATAVASASLRPSMSSVERNV